MKPLKILIVDEDASFQEVLRQAFTREDEFTQVSGSVTAAEFLTALQSDTPDCIVMDLALGIERTLHLLRGVGDAAGRIPFVVASADSSQRIAIEALRCGAADFFHKADIGDGSVLVRRVRAVVAAARDRHQERRQAERRQRRLLRSVFTDPLSGLGNRRYFKHLVNSGYFLHERRQRLCCLLADIDHFKNLNDTWGHACGDEAIRLVAQALRRCADGAPVVRWGGEEFLILRPASDEASEWAWAEQTRAAIESLDAGKSGALPRITVSIGLHLTEAAALGRDSVTPADEALYLAKRHGRNRVCTDRMVRTVHAAASARRRGGSIEQRRRALIEAMGDELGHSQRVHLLGHSARVHQLAMELATVVGLDTEQQALLGESALLHDIGKLVIPETILSKPFQLDPMERRIIDRHSEFGARICEALGVDERVARIVAEHHTPLTRTGCDHAHRLVTAVLAVADVVAAMTTDRAYSRARPMADVLRELRTGAGQRYSPDVISAAHRIPSVLGQRAA